MARPEQSMRGQLNRHSNRSTRHFDVPRTEQRRDPRPPTETAIVSDRTPQKRVRRGEQVWASELDGQLVGVIGISRAGADALRIDRFQIDPAVHHTKVLDELFQSVLAYCTSEGCRKLEVDPGCMPGWIRKQFRQLSDPAGIVTQ